MYVFEKKFRDFHFFTGIFYIQNAAIDLRLEYWEFDQAQKYKSCSNVSLIPYSCIKDVQSACNGSVGRGELRIVVLGIRNLQKHVESKANELRVKCKLMKSEENKKESEKTRYISPNVMENFR